MPANAAWPAAQSSACCTRSLSSPMSKTLRRSAASSSSSRSNSSVDSACCCSTSATQRLRLLSRLLPLPCANNTSARERGGRSRSPGSARGPMRTCWLRNGAMAGDRRWDMSGGGGHGGRSLASEFRRRAARHLGCMAAGGGAVAIRQSVVRISAAIEPAFCSARRVTLAGSITPICSRSPYSRVAAL